ncbi:MAG TPA: hypothetical protein DCE41_36905 [Cytophagales bacterium]|nr:hypothetical protein [Cytophagales bacterium]HAA21150.1 hypothetical protein [Cytophagales bacterium]HAP60671.1 hypothetical protein [Cytophagales bacterium]
MKTSMKSLYTILLAAVGLLVLGACEKIIDVDLNDAEPTLVVEANLNNEFGPQTVVLTRTTSFFTPETPGAVTNATVTVTDDQGEEVTYDEVEDGVYVAVFAGVPGRTYTLQIDTEGETFTAVSEMRPIVSLDSLTFSPGGGFGPQEGPPTFLPFTNFNDPDEKGNFYRVTEVSEDPARTAFIYLLDDLATNGNLVTFPLFGNSLIAGDTVTIELWHLDPAAHTYFDELGNTGGGGPFNSSTPANPTTNLDNGALGYFNAYSKSSVTEIVLP